jgi:hypothetical protein
VKHDTEILTLKVSQWKGKTQGFLLDQASKRGFRLLQGQDPKKAVTKTVLLNFILEHDGLIKK